MVHYAGCTTCSPPTDVISEVDGTCVVHARPLRNPTVSVVHAEPQGHPVAECPCNLRTDVLLPDGYAQATVTECNNAFAQAFALSKCLQQRHFLNDGRSCMYNATSTADA